MKHTRKRYQHGSLTIEKRKKGPSVWVYRWREMNTSGELVNRKSVIGDKAKYPTKASALKAVDGLKLEINIETPTGIYRPLSIGQLVIHYRETELCESNTQKTAPYKVCLCTALRQLHPSQMAGLPIAGRSSYLSRVLAKGTAFGSEYEVKDTQHPFRAV